MPGIFEKLIERMDRLEFELSELRVSPVASGDVWSEGGVTVADAIRFSGIGRTELYRLMGTGELPFAQPTRNRVVPRRWLREYLAKSAIQQITNSHTTST